MILVANGSLLTGDPALPWLDRGGVVVDDDGLIREAGPEGKLKKAYPGARYIDARGGVIMPGLVNLHHHCYSAFARGLSMKGYRPAGFLQILEGMWWRLDRAMTLEDVYHSAAVTFLECVRSGVTTVFDHHASYGAIQGSLSEVSRAADRLGLRACLCYEVSDRDGEEKCTQAIEENLRFLREATRRKDDMRHGMMGMHAAFTLSDRTLERCVEALPPAAGCHIHVAEGLDDARHSLQTYGKPVVRRLRDRGVLGRKTIAAHSIHLNWEEVQLLRETDTMVVHNPQSNMGNAVGCANIPEYVKAGVTVGLGTDGYTSDMLESCKAAGVLAKHHSQDPGAGAEIPGLLFQSNAAMANRYFKTPLGVLKAGAAGDIIVVDYHPFTPMDGCPAGETEKIARYLLEQKKLGLYLKCNPTLLGYEETRRALDGLGFGYMEFDREQFDNDLQYRDAVPMLRRLWDRAGELGLFFGVKLTNTFPVRTGKGQLPDEMMYMSGRALLPLSLGVAEKLSADFDGRLPVSYCGGANAQNAAAILATGIGSVTVCTDLLKPGGYHRLHSMAVNLDQAGVTPPDRVDAGEAGRLARTLCGPASRSQELRRGPVPEQPDCIPGCKTVCGSCATLCPNRANVVITAAGRQQLLHLDGPCNECGNCASFCPDKASPYREKLTLFCTGEELRASRNSGFAPEEGSRTRFLVRWRDALTGFDLDDPAPALEPEVAAVIRAVVRNYPYLMYR